MSVKNTEGIDTELRAMRFALEDMYNEICYTGPEEWAEEYTDYQKQKLYSNLTKMELQLVDEEKYENCAVIRDFIRAKFNKN